MAYGLKTYTDIAEREDLLDILKEISPEDISFDKLLKKRIDSVRSEDDLKKLKTLLEEE